MVDSTSSLLSRSTFTAASATASYLLYRSMVPPSGSMDIATSKERSKNFVRNSFAVFVVYRTGLLGLGALNSVTALLSGPPLPSILCDVFGVWIHNTLAPRFSGHVDATYVGWNPWSVIALSTIAGSAYLRLRAMGELGKDFTFEIRHPEKLNTSGMYAWVQHPSYTTALISFCAGTTWFTRIDGAVGGWVPEWLWEKLLVVQPWGQALACVGIVAGLWWRIGQEEKMLKERFGKEWVEWNKKTARLVPGLF